ncbi:hypothetical protein GCK32_007459 [Trichostrongylus colubriformis]|uniref:Chitin-binding type-2 domain-containing protein n=1 Tax=Trichostrongylus colubriformis TaxID=6319 RepID=A0AAN8FNH6_TRICO
MRILLLLTLSGLAVGLGVDRICDGRVNGVYATSPCSNKFNHCYNGQVTIKTCPRGLVFNPDSNQCDFDSNVAGCAARAEVTCSNREDGAYTIGCSSSFFFCSNGIIHMSTCQNGLFYDVDRKTCDHKFRVRACGGHPEVEREPVTRPPLVVPTYAPTALKSYAKISGYAHVAPDLSRSCKGKTDGAHSLGSCSQQYVLCTDEVSQLAECAPGEVFGDSGDCVLLTEASGCSAAMSGISTFDCSSRQDGYYGMSCSSEFVYCNGGVAQPMKCPSLLVFNQALGYCDYPEGCSSALGLQAQSQTSAHSQQLPSVESTKSVSTSFCAMRKDGFYAEKCSADFVSCKHGAATPMRCPSGLLFNDKKGYCDYPEDCASDHSPSAQGAPTTSPPFDCKGKKDGYYSNGCVREFVYCLDGVASRMNCPPSLVFNEKEGYCDYAESCSAEFAAVAAAPTAPPLSSFASDDAVPIPSLCKGKKDGYYSNGCSAEFVYCLDGVAAPMSCPSSLVFNAEKGYCDYPERCSAAPAQAAPVPSVVAPHSVVTVQSQSATGYSPSIRSSSIDCHGRKDGYYSNGCVADFVYCVDGVASPMTCPTSLVFNEKKGYCDYVENCSAGTAPAVPVAAPADVAQPAVKTQSSVASAYVPLTSFSIIDCKGRKDGYYSDGCVPDFVYCIDGVASAMKCPSSLVFNERKGYCDYAENCAAAHPAPTPVLQVPAPSVKAHSSPAPAYVPPAPSAIECKGRKDGYYSNGCVANFVYCVNEVASPMTCPTSLVFNEKKGYCDYPESCIAGAAPVVPVPVPDAASPVQTVIRSQSSVVSSYAQHTPSSLIDCKGRKDGYYSDGCVADFVFCIDGKASPMKCPASLVFNEKKGYCDYVENCSLGPAPAVAAANPVVVAPSKTVVWTQSSVTSAHAPPTSPSTIDCKGRKDGYYSDGCVAEFVSCVDGVAFPMTCPASLVFNEKKGYCDYPESCIAGAAPAVPVPVPVPAAAKPAQTVIRSHTSAASSYAQHTPSPLIDCKGKKDGYYSNGCVADFVSCVDGVASTMTCPTSLVFNEKKGYCDYVENCSAGTVPAVPVAAPADVAQPAVRMQSSVASAYAPLTSSSNVDCKGRKDGYYSNGCVPDFVYCIDGVASAMKCPASLVFNERKGYCDYAENCAVGSTPARSAPTPVLPVPAPVRTQSSPAPPYAPPVSSSSYVWLSLTNGCLSVAEYSQFQVNRL